MNAWSLNTRKYSIQISLSSFVVYLVFSDKLHVLPFVQVSRIVSALFNTLIFATLLCLPVFQNQRRISQVLSGEPFVILGPVADES